MKSFLAPALLGTLLALAGCNEIPDSSYAGRGTPESLLDVSVETATIPLDKAQGIDDLVAVLNANQPSSATLQCVGKDVQCRSARQVLQQFHVPVTEQASNGGNQVMLTYQRIIARDCDPRYVDNSINPYNLNHPAFGCANAANMVQQVSDKRQFFDPALLGNSDGSKVRQNYNEYMKPPEKNDQGESLLSSGQK